jgi:hypothetical protein
VVCRSKCSPQHLGVQLRLDLHGHEFLEKQFTRVGNLNLANIFSRVASFAVVFKLVEVGLTEETALLADMHAVAVRDVEESLLQEPGRPVRDHAVALHLTESKATVTSSSLSRLSCQNLSGTSTSRVDFVAHHMLQTLIVGRTQEDHDLKLLASEAIVHDFVSVSLVAQGVQLARNEVDRLSLEWRGVALVTVKTCHFAENALDQMTNRHSRRNSVRIDNHVRVHTLDRERQVLLAVSHATGSLLTVTTGELVSDLWDFDCAHFHFDKTLVLLVRCHDDLVNVAFL